MPEENGDQNASRASHTQLFGDMARMTSHDPIKTFSATLAASSFVALTQLITRSDLSPSLHFALLMFSWSMPLLAVLSFMNLFDCHYDIRELKAGVVLDNFLALTQIAALFGALIGIGALFSHFRTRYGVVFGASSVLSVCILNRVLRRLSAARTQVEQR